MSSAHAGACRDTEPVLVVDCVFNIIFSSHGEAGAFVPRKTDGLDLMISENISLVSGLSLAENHGRLACFLVMMLSKSSMQSLLSSSFSLCGSSNSKSLSSPDQSG